MAVERVQRRALRIIFGPELSYDDALARVGLMYLGARRHLACMKFVTEIMYAVPLFPPNFQQGSFVAAIVFAEVKTIMCYLAELTGSQNS